jgi:HPt (histidine-containing phosphotransfer) domain-containing protein
LNRSAGLQRWNGLQHAYAEALARFDIHYSGLAAALFAHAAGGDAQELRMLAHKARGVAANLGLEQLSDALAALELLAGGADGSSPAPGEPRLQAALDQMAGIVAAALAALRAGTQPAPEAPAAPAQDSRVDLGRARRAGAALLQALARGALDDAALAALAAALAGHPAAARVDQVQSALADFDFDLAQQQLEAALAAIGPETAEETAQ